jgi:hypothetical protein
VMPSAASWFFNELTKNCPFVIMNVEIEIACLDGCIEAL